MLKLIEITKTYPVAGGDVQALKGVSVNFRRNEFVSILGPSGCGKTTLLNLIGGLDRYTDGDLIIDDKSTRDFKSRDWNSYRNHSVGFVFQSYNLIPHLTVLQNVELALTISGISRKKKKALATDALIRVGLSEMLKKRPNQLSGGQMQRVAIARAIVNNPRIILADEPTGALDSTTSVQIMDLLQEISDDKLVIMVTHNPDLAHRYSTRIIELSDGEIVADSMPYDGLPTMITPVAPVNTLSPLEEEASHVVTQEQEPAQKPAKGGKRGRKANAEKDKVADESQAPKSEKFVAVVSPEKPQQLTKRSGQPKEKKQRTSMSFFTAVGLSARNLITKKTRTILTALAGSIGIIGIALVLSLSNGFNLYMESMEQNIIAVMPVTISSTSVSVDIQEVMQMPSTEGQYPDTDYVIPYDPDDVAGIEGITISANILTEDYIAYVRNMDSSWLSSIQYKYSLNMRLVGHTSEDNSASTISTSTIGWQELLWDEYMLSQYDVIYGAYPGTEEADAILAQYDENAYSYEDSDENNYDGSKARQAVLVISSYNTIDVGILEALGIYPETDGTTYANVSFEDIIGTQFQVVTLDNRYSETTNASDRTIYLENSAEEMIDQDGNITVTIVGVLRIKSDVLLSFLSNGIAYTEDLTNLYIANAIESKVGQAQINNNDYNILTGNDFSIDLSSIVTMATAYGISESTLVQLIYNAMSNNDSSYFSLSLSEESLEKLQEATTLDEFVAIFLEESKISTLLFKLGMAVIIESTLGIDSQVILTLLNNAYTSALQSLGATDLPTAIYIYPKNFDYKDLVLEYLDAWNVGKSESTQVTYTDMAGTFSEVLSIIVDLVTYVLIAFSAVSLIVSSVMIGIITYVSVLERTTEIGVLRSLGARKLDVANLFNAETGILGAVSGILGVFIAWIIDFPLNAWLVNVVPNGPSNFAVLSITHAILLVVLSTVLTILSGLIPAMLAARKDPVKALRDTG